MAGLLPALVTNYRLPKQAPRGWCSPTENHRGCGRLVEAAESGARAQIPAPQVAVAVWPWLGHLPACVFSLK